MQREIPEWVNLALAKESKGFSILDCGGNAEDPISVELLETVTMVSPNETELKCITNSTDIQGML